MSDSSHKGQYKYKSEPWTKSVLDLLSGRNGITGEFKYSTLGIHILSEIITKVSNMPTSEFANEYLFKPLGIEEIKPYVVKNKYEHISFVTSKSPKEIGWFCDNNGIVTAGFGLCLSAEDLAKIGQLCLNKGLFDNTQTVSSEWITQMTTPYIKCDEKFAFMQYDFFGGL